MRLPLAAIVLLLALGAAACVNSTSGPGTVHPKTSKTSTGGTTGSKTASTTVTPPKGTFSVPCTSATAATLIPPNSARYGPVVFAGAYANRGHASDYKPVASGRYVPTHMVVLVARGKSAIVVVPMHERHRISLLFNPSSVHSRQPRPVSEGAPAVIFQACKAMHSPWVEYTGAAIIAGAHCTKLIVGPLQPGTHKQAGTSGDVQIPYGRKSCHH